MARDEFIPPLTDVEIRRYWAKVQKGHGCWEWIAGKYGSGYGVFSVSGRLHGAHRVAVRLDGRVIPKGMWVCHHCDNHGCVRPDHLFVATPKDNQNDMVAKGRHRWPGGPIGVKHHKAKLSEADIRSIRAERSAGVPASDVAARYSINVSHVWRIATAVNWAHVKDDE